MGCTLFLQVRDGGDSDGGGGPRTDPPSLRGPPSHQLLCRALGLRRHAVPLHTALARRPRQRADPGHRGRARRQPPRCGEDRARGPMQAAAIDANSRALRAPLIVWPWNAASLLAGDGLVAQVVARHRRKMVFAVRVACEAHSVALQDTRGPERDLSDFVDVLPGWSSYSSFLPEGVAGGGISCSSGPCLQAAL